MKTKYMRIRLTEAEDTIIRENAKQAGGTLTEYIVGVITNVITKPSKSVITEPVVITKKPDSVITTSAKDNVITNVPTKKVAMDALNKKFEKRTTEKALKAIATDKSKPATTEKLLATQVERTAPVTGKTDTIAQLRDYNILRVAKFNDTIEPSNARTSVPTKTLHVKDGKIEPPEMVSEKTEAFKPSNTCVSCSAKIKKGFLCDDCLK